MSKTKTDETISRLLEQEQPGEALPMLLSTCVKNMREGLNARFVENGCRLTSEQWRLLTMLAHQDGITQQDLAKRCDRTEVSILNLLKKLEANGHVLRQRDPVDARSNRVFLTASGRKQQRDLHPIARSHLASICTGLTPDDLDHLRRILNIMLDNMK